MTGAEYMILRYIADPARSEALNIGIAVSGPQGLRIGVDQHAATRAVRDNPRLAPDSLQEIQEILETGIAEHMASNPRTTFDQALRSLHIMSLSVSEPRYTTIDEHEADPLGGALHRLMARIVTPKRRPSPAVSAGPLALLHRTFKPLVQAHKLTQQYPFPLSKSGVPRYAHFFANSGMNVAIDAVTMSASKPAGIRQAADAEAFKIEDVMRVNQEVRSYLIYCPFVDKPELAQANELAKQVLRSAGAKIRTDPEGLVREVSEVVGI